MKRKNLKKLLAAILAVMLAVVFAGCGVAKKDDGGNAGGGGNVKPAETADPVGTYRTVYDISDMVAESLAEEDINVSETLVMHLILDLNADGSYEVSMDVPQFLTDSEAFYRAIIPGMLEDIMGASGSALDEMLQPYGGYQSYLEEMIDTAMESVETEYPDQSAGTLSEGTYTIDGKDLKLDETYGDGSVTDHGTINDDGTITIYAYMDGGNEGPLVFSK